jgi:DNA-binding GntR family transcriptional regulator
VYDSYRTTVKWNEAPRIMTIRAISRGPSSQADLAYRAVRDMLIRLEIAPGSPIVESDLMAKVGTGRTPLREALNRLEAERLVNIFPRRGTFAADINLADLALITDLREDLEGHAAARAAQRATAAERERLRLLASDLTAPDLERQMALDTTIHRAVYAAAHNHFLEDTATQYHNLAMRIWHLFTERIPDLAGHIEEHRELLESIDNGEDERARSVAMAHVRGFEAAVRSLL